MLLRILIHTARWFDKELDHIIMSVLFFFFQKIQDLCHPAKVDVCLQNEILCFLRSFCLLASQKPSNMHSLKQMCEELVENMTLMRPTCAHNSGCPSGTPRYLGGCKWYQLFLSVNLKNLALFSSYLSLADKQISENHSVFLCNQNSKQRGSV